MYFNVQILLKITVKKRKINKLKIIRLTLGIIITALLTAFFVDLEGKLSTGFHFIAHFQFIPAILFAMADVVPQLVILTVFIFLFGRLYCSVICPLGVFQDFISWISKKINKKKRFKFTKSFDIIRYILLAILIVSIIFGFGGIVGYVEPYSMYGRIATHLFKPVVMFGNNLLAAFFEWTGDYYFRKIEIPVLSIFSLKSAVIIFILVVVLSFLRGRKFCNTVCPVGLLLGFLSKLSLYKIRINKEKCNGCGLCEMNCKSECINSKEKSVDVARCVSCFNCIGKCNRNGISYSRKAGKGKE